MSQQDLILLNDVMAFRKDFLKAQAHIDCKNGIDFPDGTHYCLEIERATAKQFKERYKQNLLLKLQSLDK